MSSAQERADRKRQEQDAAQHAAGRQKECSRLEGVVAAGIMCALGEPAEFLRASARLVAPNAYRVNVFVGPHVASARVAHSFFVEADDKGRILSANPHIKKAY